MLPFLQGFIEYLPYATDIFDCLQLTEGRVKGNQHPLIECVNRGKIRVSIRVKYQTLVGKGQNISLLRTQKPHIQDLE